MPSVIEERLKFIEGLSLKQGSHEPDSTFCVMEAVAYVAGEPWSDSPACACPVISAFLRSWNDALLTDADRDRLLKGLVPKLVGTKASKAVEKKRSLMAADWLIRVHTPAWLRLAGLTAQADRIAGLPEITAIAQYPALRAPLEAVREDASAAESAVRSAAWSAAESAVESAARGAAWSAARGAVESAARSAAWGAARGAAWGAAESAVRSAAWSAAQAKLAPTLAELQLSALALVERMISVTK
jgi:hypothetical protein